MRDDIFMIVHVEAPAKLSLRDPLCRSISQKELQEEYTKRLNHRIIELVEYQAQDLGDYNIELNRLRGNLVTAITFANVKYPRASVIMHHLGSNKEDLYEQVVGKAIVEVGSQFNLKKAKTRAFCFCDTGMDVPLECVKV